MIGDLWIRAEQVHLLEIDIEPIEERDGTDKIVSIGYELTYNFQITPSPSESAAEPPSLLG